MRIIAIKLYFLIAFYLVYNPTLMATNLYIAREQPISASQEKLISKFSAELSAILPEYSINTILPSKAGNLNGDNNIILSVGEEALSSIIEGNGNSPVIALFISQPTFNNQNVDDKRITAIYSDPPPEKQVALAKAIFGKSASIGLIRSKQTNETIDIALQTAKRLNVAAKVIDVTPEKTPKEIIDSLKTTKSIILIKDKEIFQKISLEKLLILGYDINNIGIIGYSSGLVKNGALATTYVSLSDTALSVSLLLRELRQSKYLPEPKHSRYFNVALNKYVMRSLGIIEISENEVKNRIDNILMESK